MPGSRGKSTLPTVSTISISDLLDLVNKYSPDILPEDVLRHYGHTARPEGELGKSALYSLDLDGTPVLVYWQRFAPKNQHQLLIRTK